MKKQRLTQEEKDQIQKNWEGYKKTETPCLLMSQEDKEIIERNWKDFVLVKYDEYHDPQKIVLNAHHHEIYHQEKDLTIPKLYGVIVFTIIILVAIFKVLF